jgi:hypothetical protein
LPLARLDQQASSLAAWSRRDVAQRAGIFRRAVAIELQHGSPLTRFGLQVAWRCMTLGANTFAMTALLKRAVVGPPFAA